MARTESQGTLTRLAAVQVSRVRVPDSARQRQDHILVRVEDDLGRTGWGEVPRASGAEGDELWDHLVGRFVPTLLSHSWQRPTEVPDLFRPLPFVPAVQGALDSACWDLWARRRGTPLAHALGGTRTAITAGVTVRQFASPEATVSEVNRQVGAGIRRVRLDVAPGRDVDVVRAVRTAYPFLALQVHCGGRYQGAEHLESLRVLDTFDLLAIEDPYGTDLAAHAELRRELRTPLALGAAIDSLEALEAAVRAEAANAVNLSISRVGGLTPARRIHDRARDASWDVWCGSDDETGLGRSMTVALASLPGVTLPSDMPGAGTRRSPALTLVEPAVRVHDGVVGVPLTRPGSGHEIDLDALRRMTVTQTTLRA
ncbi:O-succinylbenzoate synthase [Spiractinospora alimapuensis]|uniref:enolase C-terminal domain-like protein n=1 Tax=Spiractinospora alimapuensis TaxID=2820884 RepID=UPI001F2B94F1|nr:enolase C-terminal domain-like protein [Spiractinospora alimapuensis]QVQ53316.1 O-succinylbenzoate synthase [Spiractinospora alimapuensis]